MLATAHEVELPIAGPVPIGRHLPGADIVLLDEDSVEVAPGDIGEICIFGPQVADGYRGDPEATAERFTQWTGKDGSPVRIYRTGDLGRCPPRRRDRIRWTKGSPAQTARVPHRARRDRSHALPAP